MEEWGRNPPFEKMKLTKSEKAWLKSVKKGYPEIKFFVADPIVIAYEITGKNKGKFAVAIHSEKDGKFRPKTGKFIACNRMINGECLPFEFDNWCLEEMEDRLNRLAQAFI